MLHLTRFAPGTLGIWLMMMCLVHGQTAVRRDVIDQVKQATVFIRSMDGSKEQTGSGFFCHVQGSAAYIATNAHVIAITDESDSFGMRIAGTIEVVRNSGTETEQRLDATPVGFDPANDLAVLRVTTLDAPEILTAADGRIPVETQSVVVGGFPFGQALAASSGNPSITISRAAVSSIRRDDNREVAAIQVDGSINPGNSGGPVVSSGGKLVGVAVAKVRDSQIGFVIPAARLQELLRGKLVGIGLLPKTANDGTAVVQVFGLVLDPLNNIRHVSLLTCDDRNLSPRLRPNGRGQWPALGTKFQSVPLRREGDTLLGELRWSVPKDADERKLFVQPAMMLQDGSKVFLEPGEFAWRQTASLEEDVPLALTIGTKISTDWLLRLDQEEVTTSAESIDSPQPITRIVLERQAELHRLDNKAFGLAFSPDEKLVAVAGQAGWVQLLSFPDGKSLATLKNHRNWVWSLDFSTDGRLLASSGGGEMKVLIWDVAERKLLREIKGHQGKLRDIQFIPDTHHLVSTSDDKSARIWDADSGRLIRELVGHDGVVLSARVLSSGTLMATGSGDMTARIWSLKSGEPLAQFTGHERAVWGIDFAGEQPRMATVSQDRFVRMWDLEQFEPLWKYLCPKANCWRVRFSPDDRFLAFASGDTIGLLDTATGRELGRVVAHQGDVRHMIFTSDGKRLITCGDDGAVLLWNVVVE